MSTFVVEQFVPMARGALVGFATVRAPSGTVFHDSPICRSGDKFWAGPAAKPRLGRDGLQMVGANGKGLWTPVVSFSDKATRDKWSDAVIAALRTSHPEAFT